MTPSSLPAQPGQSPAPAPLLASEDVLACAARLLAADAATMPTALEQGLAQVAVRLRAQRVYVWALSDDGACLTCLHEHRSEGSRSPRAVHAIGAASLGWMLGRLLAFEAVHVLSRADLPDEAAGEQEWMAGEGLQSLLCLPLLSAGACVGALVTGWTDGPASCSGPDVTYLRFIGQVLGATVQQARTLLAVRQTASRLHSFVSGTDAPICCLEHPAGVVVEGGDPAAWQAFFAHAVIADCNGAFAALCGAVEPSVVCGRCAKDVMPELAALMEANLMGVLPPPHRIEGVIVNFAGVNDALVLRASASAVVETGRLMRVWATFVDVTQQRRIQREREVLETQLRQAQRLESIGLLAGGVAHDFNNVLVAVLNYAELALRTVNTNPSAAAEDVRAIIKAANRAAGLTRQLLAFSRQQPMQKQPLNLNDLIRGLMKMLRRLIHESVDLDFVPGHALGTIMADPGQVEQVLLNLIVNANDAIHDIGRITVETENVVLNGNYIKTHPWARPGRYVLLSVSDTGTGMTEDVRERAFEPFFSTKGQERGSGLGLSTAYGIVKQHDGMIHLYSEPGHGSRFKIYLPIVERAASDVGGRVDGVVRGGTETILLAEDNELVRQVVCTLLERAGYKVLAARDGGEAARIFDQEADNIDLALLDAVMPVMSGRAVYHHIQAQRPQLPVLFASGYTSGVFPEEFVREHQGRLLEKPYDSDTLLRRIRTALDAADSNQMP